MTRINQALEETEPIFFEGLIDMRHPLHLTMAFGQIRIFRVIDMNTVTAPILGHITGRIRLF